MIDIGHGAYTGIYSHRQDVLVQGGTNFYCNTAYQANSVYVAAWVGINDAATEWVEIGTDHHCDPDATYWYWGYGWGGTYNSLGYEFAAVDGTWNYYQIHRNAEWWYWDIGPNNKARMYWNTIGVNAQSGIESYNPQAVMDWGIHDTLNETLQESPWTPFNGYVSVQQYMCGVQLSVNSFRARQQSPSGVC